MSAPCQGKERQQQQAWSCVVGGKLALLRRAVRGERLAEAYRDAGQSKCRVERSQALEQARRPQEAMFIPECNEDGTFAQALGDRLLHVNTREIDLLSCSSPSPGTHSL
ncbi:SPARC-related modular calcium-binding protein 1 [Liparis tanakae]|uniref:SPARC-related modular calcium-binding protein 1 n=1 Tax=Liparis tanakae TaxID=230148 RepID=A0A4Z2H0I0_9TELE|nr:SPARC-related modular calcium-binding protein 1 [Liparis tanakae]